MNRDVMEDLSDAYKVAFEFANEVATHAEEKAAFQSTPEDIRSIASSLFIAYNKRTERTEKADPSKIGKGNNDDKPASVGQIRLIKTLVMEGGIRGENALEEMKDVYGYGELEELNMGQAHMVIDHIKESKKRE